MNRNQYIDENYSYIYHREYNISKIRLDKSIEQLKQIIIQEDSLPIPLPLPPYRDTMPPLPLPIGVSSGGKKSRKNKKILGKQKNIRKKIRKTKKRKNIRKKIRKTKKRKNKKR